VIFALKIQNYHHSGIKATG